MTSLYNFLFSWQLFPEKGNYEIGERPLSGIYKIRLDESNTNLILEMNWRSLNGEGFEFTWKIELDGKSSATSNHSKADEVSLKIIDNKKFKIELTQNQRQSINITHEIMPNGYLKLVEEHFLEDGRCQTNEIYYHKQMSVLPYSSSVSGAVIKPTEEGSIRHKALTAMEEQTNIQLQQIRQQVELLAIQAQEIHQRKELSMKIYNAKITFIPVIGKTYHLYERKDGSNTLSLVSPLEWGSSMPFASFIASVKLLADHTWIEVK